MKKDNIKKLKERVANKSLDSLRARVKRTKVALWTLSGLALLTGTFPLIYNALVTNPRSSDSQSVQEHAQVLRMLEPTQEYAREVRRMGISLPDSLYDLPTQARKLERDLNNFERDLESTRDSLATTTEVQEFYGGTTTGIPNPWYFAGGAALGLLLTVGIGGRVLAYHEGNAAWKNANHS